VENIFDKILKENDSKKRGFLKKVNNFLKKEKFFDLNLDKKTEYLLSMNGLKTIMICARQNLQLIEIAQVLKIPQKNLMEIKTANPKIYDAFDFGYSQRMTQVQDAIYKLATGYYMPYEKVQELHTGNRVTKKVFKEDRYFPPDVRAAQYILNNKAQFEYKKDTDKMLVPESNQFAIKISFGEDES